MDATGIMSTQYLGWFRPSRRERWRLLVESASYGEAMLLLTTATEEYAGGEIMVTEGAHPASGEPVAPSLLDATASEAP
jgi:hypothetical protein